MDTLSAFAMGEANRDKPAMVFDWDKAAGILRERKSQTASAGLRADWEYTGGEILRDGKPVLDGHPYLQSTWAVPELEIDGDIVECFRLQEGTGWCSDTVWPESALKILEGR